MTTTPLRILQTVFGHAAFRSRQAEIVDHLLAGGDALVVMPTGGGKSICYQVPALLRPGTGLVVSPLIALMQDQVAALRQLGVRAAFLNSSLPPAEARRVEGLLRRGELDLLYVAPERLLQERTLALLAEVAAGPGLALFAIDEAHCVSEWGHDFRPEYLQLDVLAERFAGVPRLACTATADERTRREIVERLRLRSRDRFQLHVTGFDRPNIRYRVVPKRDPRRQLLRLLRDEHPGDAGIVYCLTRRRTEQIADFLRRSGLTALPYHAGLGAATRQEHQDRFLREDGVVIVATIAFGMGIDKPDVRFVAHLDLPRSLEAYYQETGRAGRDGLAATAWLAYGLQDVVMLRKLQETGEADEMHRRRERQQLDAMLGYCELTTCRRQALLRHFGEELAAPCGNCDTCLTPPETFDGTVAAQKLLSCAVRTGQRFGAGHLIEVLLGSASERVERLGHDRLPTFGVGRELDALGWRAIVRQLVARGLLELDREGYGSLLVGEEGRAVLRGERTVELRRDVVEPAGTGRTRREGRAERRRRRAAAAALETAGTAEPDPGAERLFERLRALRRELAAEQGVPPYVVFHDRTLAAMAVRRPRTPEQLLDLDGVGRAKLERYGAAFLAAIRETEAPGPDEPADPGDDGTGPGLWD